MIAWITAGILLAVGVLLASIAFRSRVSVRQLENLIDLIKQENARELIAANRLRDGLLKVVDDALLVMDQQRRIVLANPAAESLIGHSLVGETLVGAIRHPEIDTLMEDAHLVGGEGVERRIELDKRILHARAITLHTVFPELYEILTLRDVTEVQRLERSRRDMVSNVTHELSHPITAIGLLADTLLDTAMKEKPKKTRKMAADIRREVDTLTQLVQEMRDLSLIESGQMLVRLMPCQLQALLQASVEPLLPLAESKHQVIQVSVPEQIFVLADEMQLQRALKNIVHNAVKFTPDGGRIHLSATAEDDEAIIRITDTGPGIPPDDLPRIFERFFQVDRARSNGTGLGLAIVRHIVQAHGGRVWAESRLGEGAVFSVALVLAEPVKNI